MSDKFGSTLVVAISSRALFDMDSSHAVYADQGVGAYSNYQIAHEKDVLKPGEAFHLVNKLLKVNEWLGENHVEVVLLSRNTADTGLRVFNSIEHYGLPITRAAFTGGRSPYRYAAAFGCHLFLSGDYSDVRSALENGIAAAQLVSSSRPESDHEGIHFAFDGDAVLFSDESEVIFKREGLEAFSKNEKQSAATPLMGGPFKPFLSALHDLQQAFGDDCPIRTALVTARGAPAHERVIRTLRSWKVRLDESVFLGGVSKGEFLKAFKADVFFDDQEQHCLSAREHVATGHVPHGIANTE